MDSGPGNQPLVLGHRGASATEPENTVAAFIAADAAGADGVELDVRLTSDDVMVINHDPHVREFGTIWNQSFERLRATRPEIPTLDEAAAACGEMLINIEIKNEPSEPGFDPTHRAADAVAAWIRANPTRRVLVSSFNRDTVAVVKDSDASIPTGQLVARSSVLTDRMAEAVDDGHEWILPHRRYLKRDADVTERAHSVGLKIGVWTVDAEKWLERFAAAGVDAVITNDPAKAVALYSA